MNSSTRIKSSPIKLSPAMRAAVLASVLTACSSDGEVIARNVVANGDAATAVKTTQTATFALG
jgi:hypothetical protein